LLFEVEGVSSKLRLTFLWFGTILGLVRFDSPCKDEPRSSWAVRRREEELSEEETEFEREGRRDEEEEENAEGFGSL